jgi:hypothetical protein
MAPEALIGMFHVEHPNIFPEASGCHAGFVEARRAENLSVISKHKITCSSPMFHVEH